ncbi:hypothetical protein F2Q70_00037537 [Brassica cretica]|uniref:Uncharacterized protein n=1 Tax=Brassica cretica TaxID=69181 RepID=A0A8S9JXL7_BRACR|nr:hypothetical protein F2Q70_00037537 [Brassica cretica]
MYERVVKFYAFPASLDSARLIQSLFPKDQANPPTRLDPYVHMARFTSQAGLGLSRLIHSLFPKATHSRTNKPRQMNRAFFQLRSEKAALSEERPKLIRKEVGPSFQLLFKGVKKVSLDTGSLKLICMPPASHYDYPERQLMIPPI